MTGDPQPDWHLARQLLREWLRLRGYSIRDLAKRSGLQPSVLSRFLAGETALKPSSALKLYGAFHGHMHPLRKRQFLEAASLLSLAQVFRHDPALSIYPMDADLSAVQGRVAGKELMAAGHDIANFAPLEAIHLYRAAEAAFGAASNDGTWAALHIAQRFMTLGDYGRARRELERTERVYASIMDPETKAQTHTKWGWYHYYTGTLRQAERRFQQCIAIARETGADRLASEGAEHFLARTYFEMAKQCPHKSGADEWLHKAETQFDYCYQSRMRTGDNVAFDLFRKSQVLQWRGRAHEAQKLRDRARQMFSGMLVTIYVDMEEAQIALANGQARWPMRKAEEAVRGWAHIRYAKGIADSLRFLGDLETSSGRLTQAVEHYVAARCVFPPGGPQGTRELDADIRHLSGILAHQNSGTGHVQRIRTLAHERRGPFSWLDCIAADRAPVVEQTLAWLGSRDPDAEPPAL